MLIAYLLIILCALVSFFLHKRTIKQYNEKRTLKENQLKQTTNLREQLQLMIVSRCDIPKSLDEKLHSILVVCLFAFTCVTTASMVLAVDRQLETFDGKFETLVGVICIFFNALFLSSQSEKIARQMGYDNGYTDGYNDAKITLKMDEECK